MSDLARRQQDWRSARDKEAAKLREKVVGLDKTLLGFATAWAEYGNVAPATSKRVLASARELKY
jgi:hypothetical protein